MLIPCIPASAHHPVHEGHDEDQREDEDHQQQAVAEQVETLDRVKDNLII